MDLAHAFGRAQLVSTVPAKESVQIYTQIARNVVEILAFIGGAWWAIHTFSIREGGPHIDAVEEKMPLTWTPASTPGFCQAQWTITAKNTGNKIVDVKSVRLRLWSFPQPQGKPGQVTCVDFGAPANGPFLYQKTFNRSVDPLTGDIDPGDYVAEAFTFLIPRAPAGDMIGFDVQFFGDKGAKLLYVHAHDKRCPI